MANTLITVRISGNASGNAGFEPIAILNPSTFGELEYQGAAGTANNAYYFLVHIDAAYTQYTLVHNRVRSAGASREGMLKIAIGIPKGYVLSGGKSPYDILKHLRDDFVDRHMVSSSDGSWQFRPNIDTPTVQQEAQSVIDLYALQQEISMHRPMHGTEKAAVECQTADKVRLLLADVQYAEFSMYKDVVVAEHIDLSAYTGRDLTNKIEIPRASNYQLVVNGSKVSWPPSGKVRLSAKKYCSDFDDRCHDDYEVELSHDDVRLGKVPPEVVVDKFNETATCTLHPKDKNLKVDIQVEPDVKRDYKIEVFFGSRKVKIDNRLTTIKLVGRDIVAPITVNHSMKASYIVEESNPRLKDTAPGKASLTLTIWPNANKFQRPSTGIMTTQNAMSTVMQGGGEPLRITIEEITRANLERIVGKGALSKVGEPFTVDVKYGAYELHRKMSPNDQKVSIPLLKEWKNVDICIPEWGVEKKSVDVQANPKLRLSDFVSIGKSKSSITGKPWIAVVAVSMLALASGIVIGHWVWTTRTPESHEAQGNANLPKVETEVAKEVYPTPLEDSIRSWKQSIAAADLTFARVEDMYSKYEQNKDTVRKIDANYADKIEVYHQLVNTIGTENDARKLRDRNKNSIEEIHMEYIEYAYAFGKGAHTGYTREQADAAVLIYGKVHAKLKSFTDFKTMIKGRVSEKHASDENVTYENGMKKDNRKK